MQQNGHVMRIFELQLCWLCHFRRLRQKLELMAGTACPTALRQILWPCFDFWRGHHFKEIATRMYFSFDIKNFLTENHLKGYYFSHNVVAPVAQLDRATDF